MTEFLEDHPGGSEIIMNNRSKDVTHIFNPRHPSDQLEEQNLPPSVHHLGVLSTEGASEEEKDALLLKMSKDEEDEEARIKKEREAMEERKASVDIRRKSFAPADIPETKTETTTASSKPETKTETPAAAAAPAETSAKDGVPTRRQSVFGKLKDRLKV